LIDTETTGGDREQSAVCRYFVTDSNINNIAWDELGGVDADNLTSSKNFCFVGGIFLESLDDRGE